MYNFCRFFVQFKEVCFFEMKRGILRIIFVNLISVSLLFCCGFSATQREFAPTLIIKEETPQNVNPEIKENSKKEEKTELPQVNSAPTQSSQQESVSSESVIEVAAEAIKGKILSQYNSP